MGCIGETMAHKVTIPRKEYNYLKKIELEWNKWCKDAEWLTDNHGQALIYTGLDMDGNELQYEEEE
jgi:hypothetical protein